MRKFIPVIVLCCVLSPAPAAEKWTQAEVWRQQLRKGMTDRDVLKILGEPKDKEIGRSTTAWYYQECPERVDAKVVSRPSCGFVKFSQVRASRTSRRLIYQVYDWKEPDWELLKETIELELQKAAEIEVAKVAEAEAKRLEAEKAIELRREERRQKQLARKQEIEERRKARQQRTESQKQQASMQPRSKEPKEFSFSIFIFAGLILMGLAFFGAVFFKKTWD